MKKKFGQFLLVAAGIFLLVLFLLPTPADDPGWTIQFEPYYDMLTLFKGVDPTELILGGFSLIVLSVLLILWALRKKGGDE
mgnify:FL=1